MAATSGNSHSIDCGSGPICSGVVKVAITRAGNCDILISGDLCLAKMSQINSVDNAQEVKQARGAGVYLSDFVRPAIDGEATGGGDVAEERHQGRIHNLCCIDVPRGRPDCVYDADGANV